MDLLWWDNVSLKEKNVQIQDKSTTINQNKIVNLNPKKSEIIHPKIGHTDNARAIIAPKYPKAFDLWDGIVISTKLAATTHIFHQVIPSKALATKIIIKGKDNTQILIWGTKKHKKNKNKLTKVHQSEIRRIFLLP